MKAVWEEVIKKGSCRIGLTSQTRKHKGVADTKESELISLRSGPRPTSGIKKEIIQMSKILLE